MPATLHEGFRAGGGQACPTDAPRGATLPMAPESIILLQEDSMLACAHLAFFFFLSTSTASDQTVELLRAKDQALLDAFVPGDKKIWEAALASDAVYVDENGVTMDRAAFLDQLHSLSPGTSGEIHMSTYSAQVAGDWATVIHTDEEQENYHGQMLYARYLTTETWRRLPASAAAKQGLSAKAGDWKLCLVHTVALLKDPPAVSFPAAELREYAGRYLLAPGSSTPPGSDQKQTASPLVFVIEWNGKELLGGREGSALKPLLVEIRDVLFVPGQPRIRKIFQRDATGQVTGFADRRESWDLVWRRIGGLEAPVAPR
jgi:Domain of unknown function (DUF4440)